MRSSAWVTSALSSSAQTSSTRPSKSFASSGSTSASGHDAVAVALDHRQRAAGEVAVVVGELGLVALAERGRRDAAVLAERDLAEAVEAQRVRAELVHHLERVEHVAQRLGHLRLLAARVAHQQVAVDELALRDGEVGGHQHRRPEDGVELEDVLAEDVERRRPEAVGQVLAVAGEGERRVVVEQRVEPDVEDVRRVPRDLDAPGDLRPAERDVLEAAVDERERLVRAAARRDPVGPLGVERLQPVLEASTARRTSSPRARGRAGCGGSGTCCPPRSRSRS